VKATEAPNRPDAFLGGDGLRRLNGQAPSHSLGRTNPGGASRIDVQPDLARAAAPGLVEERNRQIRDSLADSDVFGALADDDLDRLIGQGRIAAYARGAIVFRKGDPAAHLMIVVCGRIRLSSASRNGKEVLFDFIGPGRALENWLCSSARDASSTRRPSSPVPSSPSATAMFLPASKVIRRSRFGSSVCSARGSAAPWRCSRTGRSLDCHRGALGRCFGLPATTATVCGLI
jgi:Cyclic nucleotide-binding domain